MADIIDFAARLAGRQNAASITAADPVVDPYAEYKITITRNGEHIGCIDGANDVAADEMRRMADDLEEFAHSLRATAYESDNDPNLLLVGEYRVFASGRMRGWMSPEVQDQEQLDWLRECVVEFPELVPATIPVEIIEQAGITQDNAPCQ